MIQIAYVDAVLLKKVLTMIQMKVEKMYSVKEGTL